MSKNKKNTARTAGGTTDFKAGLQIFARNNDIILGKQITKVFVTTLSRAFPSKMISYYCDSNGGVNRYFAGAFTNEPGAKYILSRVPIEKMVVLYTDEAFRKGSEQQIPDLRQVEPDPAHWSSSWANEVFTYRMAQFLRGEERDLARQAESISPSDREALERFVGDFMREHGYTERSQWFELLGKEKKTLPNGREVTLSNELRNELRQRLEARYLTAPELAEAEQEQTLARLPELQRLEAGDLSAQEMIENLQKLQREAWQNLQSREQFLLLGVTSVENRIAALRQERLEKHNEALSAVIERLRDLNARLLIEVSNTRTRRGAQEWSYVQKYLFDQIDSVHRLYPLDKLPPIEVEFVPQQRGEIDNIRGLIDAIRGKEYDRERKIELYVDVQGGDRTGAFVRSQIFTILSNETAGQIAIRQIFSNEFYSGNFVNYMKDETRRYQQ